MVFVYYRNFSGKGSRRLMQSKRCPGQRGRVCLIRLWKSAAAEGAGADEMQNYELTRKKIGV